MNGLRVFHTKRSKSERERQISCDITYIWTLKKKWNEVTSVMSDSVQPHRRQPTRLPSPWDSPGKNTGVGCHFLLQCMKVKSESEVAQSGPPLSDPMDCSLPGSSIHGIFQAEYWSGVQSPSPMSIYLPEILWLTFFFLTENTKGEKSQ